MSRREVSDHDWPPEIIKARLHMAGLSLRSLSLKAGYSRDSLKSVLRTPCRPYQQIIADALGVSVPSGSSSTSTTENPAGYSAEASCDIEQITPLSGVMQSLYFLVNNGRDS